MARKTKIGESKIQGNGLLTALDLPVGTNVGVSHIGGWPTNNIGKYYNHSETPNAISKKVGNKRYVHLTRDLGKNEEITLNYRLQPELEQPQDGWNYGGSVKMQDGGPNVMDGMSRGRMAIAAELGNPAAKRMLSPNPKTGMTPEGEGSHYMVSMGEYAVPLLQDKGDYELEYNENPEPSSEDIKFNTEEEAEYFAQNYKKHVPESSALFGMMSGGNTKSYQSGGPVLKNTFAQVNPLSINMQGLATRSNEELDPGFGVTFGKNRIGGRAIEDAGFDSMNAKVNLNLPYDGGKPSVYGDVDFKGDLLQMSNINMGQAYGKIGAGWDPNLGVNASLSGGAKAIFSNRSEPTYRKDNWRQGAMRAEIGPEAGVFFRNKGLDTLATQGEKNNTKAGLTYGGTGKIEVQPFKFPLRLSAEGSMMWNPGAGKTMEGKDQAGKIQGKWQPGIQVGAKIPLNAFQKPKNTSVRIPPEKENDLAEDWVRDTPSGKSPNMGYTQGRISKSIWRDEK